MCLIIPYYTFMRQSKDPKYLRLKIVQLARDKGNKSAARAFRTTVKTVRKWRRRYENNAYHGLNDESKAPKKPHRAITNTMRRKFIELKQKLPSWGAERLKRDFSLPVSVKSIYKIWKNENLIKRKRKKHKTKNDLRKIKQQWRLFEQIDIDTKYLYDIPEYWPQMRSLRLPQFQYTARDVVSGAMFLGFADELAITYATTFANIILHHLKRSGVNLEGCRIQTDNSSEFIGSWNIKHDSAFTRIVQNQFGLQHTTIPPGAHTYQADVETVHRLIEDEFFEVERFSSRKNFHYKAATYQLYFNSVRKNSYKNYKTPWDIIHERDKSIKPTIFALTPLFLDNIYKNNVIIKKPPGGYHVGSDPYSQKIHLSS